MGIRSQVGRLPGTRASRVRPHGHRVAQQSPVERPLPTADPRARQRAGGHHPRRRDRRLRPERPALVQHAAECRERDAAPVLRVRRARRARTGPPRRAARRAAGRPARRRHARDGASRVGAPSRLGPGDGERRPSAGPRRYCGEAGRQPLPARQAQRRVAQVQGPRRTRRRRWRATSPRSKRPSVPSPTCPSLAAPDAGWR